MEEKSNLPRSAKRVEDTTYDRIWKYYFHKDTEIALSENEEEMRERWQEAWRLRCDILTKAETVEMLVKNYNVSIRTAYYDIVNSQKLFGNPQEGNKAALKVILTEILTKALKKAYDAKSYDIVEKISGRISKINGLEDKDDNLLTEMLKNMKPHTIVFSADPETLRKQAESLMEGVDEETHDVDFEEEEDEDS